MTDRSADVCIVGAGIVGLAHAIEARRRGLTVAVLDRDDRAVGASVRNFGHVFAAGQRSGDDLALALASRDRWRELAATHGLPIVEQGTLVVARAADELAVLEAAAADPARAARLLTPEETGRLAPIPDGEIVGALHCTGDIRVDPRTAVARLAAALDTDPGVTIDWSAHVEAIAPGRVDAGHVVVRAPHVVVCPGPDHRSLPAELRRGLEPVTRCRLQMLRVAAPAGRRYGPALATGLSLVRYPAFASQPEAAALRARLERERPELVAHGIHLLATQLPGGDLLIGDTHTYGDTLEPFGDEALDELLLAEARRLLGAELTVRERWHGIYASLRGAGNFFVTAPMPGVRVVEVISGLGMTLSLAQAPLVLDELLAEPAEPAPRAPSGAPTPSSL